MIIKNNNKKGILTKLHHCIEEERVRNKILISTSLVFIIIILLVSLFCWCYSSCSFNRKSNMKIQYYFILLTIIVLYLTIVLILNFHSSLLSFLTPILRRMGIARKRRYDSRTVVYWFSAHYCPFIY